MRGDVMNEETRQALVSLLDELMTEHPDWRIGQLVANIAFLACQANSATWDVENEEFLRAGREHLQKMAERRAALAEAKEQITAFQQRIKTAA